MPNLGLAFATTLFVADTAAAAPAPNDAQIASIVVTADQFDIDASEVAESKGQAKDVKAFAKEMVTDHTAVNKQAVALITKLR